MGMARYVVDAVVLEGRSVREVARVHGLRPVQRWLWIVSTLHGARFASFAGPSERLCTTPHTATGPAWTVAVDASRSSLDRLAGVRMGGAHRDRDN
jgi:hypothetical protein